jgi:hypothetical protein
MIVDFGFTWTINSTNTIQNQKSLAIRGAFLLTNSKLKHRNRWIPCANIRHKGGICKAKLEGFT